MSHFPSVRAMNMFNSRHAGKVVDSVCDVGYIRVGVFNVRYYAHRIIWKIVTGEDPYSLQINHKDGNKLNNAWSNLEAVTHSENVKHAFRTGLINKNGENHHNSKLTTDQVLKIRELYTRGYQTQELAEMYGVNNATVFDVVKYRTWKHVGGESV